MSKLLSSSNSRESISKKYADKRNKHGSKASQQSNDFMVVEEVADHDISSEAFRVR